MTTTSSCRRLRSTGSASAAAWVSSRVLSVPRLSFAPVWFWLIGSVEDRC